MTGPSAAEITGLLARWSQGDEHALDDLAPLVYRDLRRVACVYCEESTLAIPYSQRHW